MSKFAFVIADEKLKTVNLFIKINKIQFRLGLLRQRDFREFVSNFFHQIYYIFQKCVGVPMRAPDIIAPRITLPSPSGVRIRTPHLITTID